MHCDTKPFDDPKVRKAMRLAVDPPRVLQLVQDGLGAIGQHHHCSPTQPDYATIAPMVQDLDHARRLLSEAGFPKGFRTTINASANTPASNKSAQVLSEMWAKVGIDARIETVPNETFLARWLDYPLSVTFWANRPLAIMQLALTYRTGAPWNESRYSNPVVDGLIDKAQLILDPVARRPLIGQIQQLMQEDGPLVQPTWTPNVSAFNRKVSGVTAHSMGYYPAEHLSFET